KIAIALHHRNLLPQESEEFERFSSSAACHHLLHPIALRPNVIAIALCRAVVYPNLHGNDDLCDGLVVGTLTAAGPSRM
ncbi:hypothetical protein VQ042_07130, partial [Aurantimonas sp. A2-1-M11]|uniref:hypothetical protein n=1 Tax=Aurantimonas sp. A2-1-M11 TaxID=3113712 RepID=UPI002F91F2FA